MIGSPVKEVALTPTDEAASFVTVLARLADNPSVDVTKLERLIDAHERIVKSQAKADFDAAFSVMQGELPIVSERGVAHNGKFARYEDIVDSVRPVLARHGFGFRHRNERTEDGRLVIVGVLSHRAGHSEEDRFECPPDTSGNKAPIQAIGSTRSYGQRYTLRSLLGIASGDEDDDGAAATVKKTSAKEPDGYAGWLTDLELVAEQGWPALEAAWKKSKASFREFIPRDAISRLKSKAKAVKQ